MYYETVKSKNFVYKEDIKVFKSFMKNSKNLWFTISLMNLLIVASLGLLLRSKILFPIPFLDYSSVLHGHSHFAFGGWVTLALLSLMTYEILPAELSGKKRYNYLLGSVFVCAVAMLASF